MANSQTILDPQSYDVVPKDEAADLANTLSVWNRNRRQRLHEPELKKEFNFARIQNFLETNFDIHLDYKNLESLITVTSEKPDTSLANFSPVSKDIFVWRSPDLTIGELESAVVHEIVHYYSAIQNYISISNNDETDQVSVDLIESQAGLFTGYGDGTTPIGVFLAELLAIDIQTQYLQSFYPDKEGFARNHSKMYQYYNVYRQLKEIFNTCLNTEIDSEKHTQRELIELCAELDIDTNKENLLNKLLLAAQLNSVTEQKLRSLINKMFYPYETFYDVLLLVGRKYYGKDSDFMEADTLDQFVGQMSYKFTDNEFYPEDIRPIWERLTGSVKIPAN